MADGVEKVKGFKQVDNLEQEWTYWSTVLDEVLGASLPAIESDFLITLYAAKPEESYPYNKTLQNGIQLFSVISATIPSIGYEFVNTPEGTGFIEGFPSAGDQVQLTYWDTANQHFTRLIEQYYLSQFSKYGTLRIGYRMYKLAIKIGTVTYNFSSGAVTRPLPTGVNAASNALLQYRFKFAYETAFVKYDNNIPDSTVDPNAIGGLSNSVQNII